jgi:CHAT domain-containing protein/Tfp pilus assembly protein PilF
VGPRRTIAASALASCVAWLGCAERPGRSEPPGIVVLDALEPGSPLERAGLRAGDRLRAARSGGRPIPVAGFADLFLLEVEHAPRAPVVLEVERAGAVLERSLPEDRWRATARPGLGPAALALHDAARAEAAAGRPERAVAAYERLRDGEKNASVRTWASARAALARRSGAEAHWQRAAATAREAGDEALSAWAALRHCESLAESGRFADAAAPCERAREIHERLGRPLAAAEAAYRLAVIAGRRGQPREEEARHRALIERLAPLAPDGLLAARALRGLAKSRATQGDFDGAFAHARRALALVERRAPRSLDHGASVMILGIFHWFSDQWAPAEAHFLEALEIARSVDPGVEEVANALANLGMVSASRGDLAAAEDYYRQGLEAFARSGAQDPLAVSRTLNNLATVANARGDLESAIRYDREVLDLRERLVPDSIELATPLLNLGDHLVAAGRFDEAERALARALALQRIHAPMSDDVARTLVNLAEAHEGRGDRARAEDAAAEAVAITARGEPGTVLEAVALRTLAELRAARGQVEDAERQLRRACALLGSVLPGTLEEARTLHALGRLLRSSGRRAEAVDPLKRAASALDHQLSMLGGTDEIRARFRATWRHVYRDLADLLLELGRPDEAFETLERSRARAFLLLLRSRGVLPPGLSPALERERRALAADSAELQEKAARVRAAGGPEAAQALAGERRRLQIRRDQLAERLQGEPRLAGLVSVAGVSDARAALQGRAAALSYFVGATSTRLAVMGATGAVQVLELPVGEDELRDLVDRMRFLLEARAPAADPLPLAARLYERLVAPAAPLIEGAPSLLVIPDGPLHRLPFAALVEAEGARRRYLVERVPIQMAASITAWTYLQQKRPRAEGRLVAFADPEGADLERVAERARAGPLTRLPGSREEVENLAERFGLRARVVEGRQATEPAARAAGQDARVLHFATHAFFDPVSPLDSALVLAPAVDASGRRDDGLLQAWEVVQDLRLDADLVVLSACDSGGGTVIADESPIGLTRAFHFAGSRAVLASLWTAYDRSTAVLMEAFYRHWAAGRSKAEALRAAQVERIRAGAPPRVWASFGLHGDGR